MSDRIAAAFKAAPGRAALMPYLMGGFPDVETSMRVGLAYADNGADLIELGVPFSDPLADGPVIHAAATQALQAGATVHEILQAGAQIAEHVPVVLMCYANLIYARGPERFAAELEQRGISGLIVPDLPLEESEPILAACDEHASRSCRSSHPPRRTPDWTRLDAMRVDLSTRCRSPGPPASATPAAATPRGCSRA